MDDSLDLLVNISIAPWGWFVFWLVLYQLRAKLRLMFPESPFLDSCGLELAWRGTGAGFVGWRCGKQSLLTESCTIRNRGGPWVPPRCFFFLLIFWIQSPAGPQRHQVHSRHLRMGTRRGGSCFPEAMASRKPLQNMPLCNSSLVVKQAWPFDFPASADWCTVSVSYTHLTLPTRRDSCRSRWSPYH